MASISLQQRADFIASLSLGNTVTQAAKDAGISRRAAYYLKDEDPEFAGSWDNAVEAGADRFEQEVMERALDRKDQKSHILLIFHMKKLRPEYKENYKKEVTIKHDRVNEFSFTKEEYAEAISILKAAQAKETQNTSDTSLDDVLTDDEE